MIARVAHFGDIQINLSTEHADRTVEYRSALFDAAQSVIANDVDYVVIAGDVFERYNTNDDERKLYVDFIHSMLDALPKLHIIVIDGNHDIAKRNINYYDGNTTTVKTNVLAELASAINDERYHYCRDASIYSFDAIAFACYSELAKYDNNLHASPYAELTGQVIKQLEDSKFVVDVFHGTIPGAKDLGTGYEPKPDDVVLHGHAAMLGHIHKFQKLGSAVYCSSLVQRSFNECTRYRLIDGAMQSIYDYRQEHGYALWTIDTDNRQYAVELVPIRQVSPMLTIELSNDVAKEHVFELLKQYSNDTVQVKLVLDNPQPETLSYLYNYAGQNKRFIIRKVEAIKNTASISERVNAQPTGIELNAESFADIAKQLLQPVLAEQHSDKQYATDVLQATLALLSQECGYHLYAESRSNIVMKSVIIDNFRTIGHAELNFAEHGLTALRGQNGQGKTTCFEAIALCLTGQHNRTFKRNAKNKQFIRLFNDKQPHNDVVQIRCILNIDGIDYTVQMTLQKFMQADWTPANWKAKIAKIVKTLTVYDGEQVIAEGDAADAWCMQRFGTYDDFAILHMIDQNTLEALKYMTADELSNFILQRLGYAVIGRLQHFYNGCKTTEQQRVPKPTDKTYVQLCQETDDIDAEQLRLNDELSTVNSNAEQLSKTIEALQSDIEAKLASKSTLPQELLSKATADCSGYDVETIDAVIARLEQDKAGIVAELSTAHETEQQYLAVCQRANDKITSLVNLASEQLQKLIDNERSKQSAALTELNKANEANAANALHRQELQHAIDSAKSWQSALQQTIANADADIATKDKEVSEQQQYLAGLKPDTCPTCGNAIDIDKFEAYKANIFKVIDNLMLARQALYDNKARCEKQLQEQADKITEANSALSGMPLDIDISAWQEAANTAALNIQAYTDKLSKLSNANYQQQLLLANDAALAQQVQQLKQTVAAMQAYKLSEKLDTANAKLDKATLAKQGFAVLQQYDSIMQSNANIDNEVLLAKSNLFAKQTEHAGLQQTAQNIKKRQGELNTAKSNVEAMKLQVVAYNISQEALQHYKWLIFDAMPKYLYSHICSIVNAFIDSQNLPDTIRPWLSETVFGELLLRDRDENGREVYRSILEASGMEITIAGLVICFALHDAKLATNFPMVLLDELSGKLNTGTDKDDTDYLALLLQVLRNASNECQILMIDHRLKDDDFDSTITIAKDKVTNIAYTI